MEKTDVILDVSARHEIVLQSENSCPHYPLEKKKPIVQKMSKKNNAYQRDNLQ